MHVKQNKQYGYESLGRTCLALKAARLKKGLSRKDGAKALGWTWSSLEQIENARCNISEARVKRIYSGYGLSSKEFEQIRLDPKRVIAEFCDEGKHDQSIEWVFRPLRPLIPIIAASEPERSDARRWLFT